MTCTCQARAPVRSKVSYSCTHRVLPVYTESISACMHAACHADHVSSGCSSNYIAYTDNAGIFKDHYRKKGASASWHTRAGKECAV